MNDATKKHDPFEFGLRMFLAGLAAGGVVATVLFSYARSSFLTGDSRTALEETRVAVSALTNREIPLHPQLREYLKARVYGNVISIPVDWLKGLPVDFGPIDEGVLGNVAVVKDGTSASELYALAMKKLRDAK